MKEKILIAVICALALIVVAIGSYVYLVPTVDPDKPIQVVENNFPENELPKTLKISKPNTKVARVFAIRNYEKGLDAEEINSINVPIRYYVLGSKPTSSMLILPFEVGGRITVTELMWDDYEEDFVPSNKEDAVLIDEQITQNYGLMLNYDRPSTNPEYQIKITQGSTVATYKIGPSTDEEIEFVKMD